MNDLHFPNLTIKGFRGIRELTIPQLGRVNLITGKNSTGKSSVLEALRLFANNAVPSVILDTLEFREEDMNRYGEEEFISDLESLPHIAPLFHGFPQHLEEFSPIEVATSGEFGPTKLLMRVDSAHVADDANGGSRLFPKQSAMFEDSDGEIALVVETGDRTRLHRLERFLQYWNTRGRRSSMATEVPRIPCILVRSHSSERTGGLGNLWDAIALTYKEEVVIQALRIIDSRIEAISMVGSERYRFLRRAIVRATGIPRPVPLRTFGDGMNRLLWIALSLVNAGEGILLVDEFENGLHYSVQPDVWRMIFGLSQKLDIQVFATTHSRDTVEAFQKAAAESPEEGALIHLTSRRDDIIPTVFTEEELAIVARDNIEVR